MRGALGNGDSRRNPLRLAAFESVRKGAPEHRKAVENGFPTCIQIGSQPIDMPKLLQQLFDAALTWPGAVVREAGRHGTDFARGKARFDEVANAARTAQIGLAIDAIAVLRTADLHQAGLLIVAQHALRDPEPLSRFLGLHPDPFLYGMDP